MSLNRERLEKEVPKVSLVDQIETSTGLRCRLLKPIRDHEGRIRFGERPRVLQDIYNLGRHMYLVRFEDGSTTFLFPDEVAF